MKELQCYLPILLTLGQYVEEMLDFILRDTLLCCSVKITETLRYPVEIIRQLFVGDDALGQQVALEFFHDLPPR